ncbi:MAG: hypothetical protein JSR00_07045 [Bacteroidetes bacterium]|nr:hypothetical protein [Bacteroidota bacterium]
MDFIDFLVFFLWVFIFYIFILLRKKNFKSKELKFYYSFQFWLRVFSTLAYCMFILYISPGDTTTLYYPEGINIWNLIFKDFSNIAILFMPSDWFNQSLLTTFSNWGYFNHESNFMVTRLVIFFSFFTGGKFMAINLFFSMFAFSGLWRLYLFFYKQYPKYHKALAIGILFLPSVTFWSSAILKDSLCIGALGWLTYSMYMALIEKKRILLNIISFLIFSSLLFIVKSYILLAYIPFFLLFFVLRKLQSLKSPFFKIAFILFSITAATVVIATADKTLNAAMGEVVEQGLAESIQSLQNTYESMANVAESNFSLGVEFDGSVVSFIKMAPAAIAASLFRPFLWESKKISTLFSSLESLCLIFLTLYVFLKTGPIKFFKIIFTNPIIFYCFGFSILFSLFVGATTLNFGSLVRYKIPALPFYICSLLLIYYFNKDKKQLIPPDSGIGKGF